jgi:hypothetical protein
VILEVPSDDPFVRFLVQGGGRVEARYPRNADGMLLVLDPSALLLRLQGKLEERLALSHLRDRRVEIGLETEAGTAELAIGPVTGRPLRGASRLSLAGLGQMVTGYRRAAEVIGAGPAAEALDTILSGGVPYVWQADRF